MYPNPLNSGLSLGKVLNGINKTLNVANQIIPIYMQTKPMIENAKSAFGVAKEFLAPEKTSKKTIQKEVKKEPVNQKKESVKLSSNNPVFFL